jgi:two-component system, chemotaxis family, protein-glutamate methylesterase/glutaminase
MPVSVIIVDDSRFFRTRIKDILEQDSGIKVIDSAENGQSGVEKVIAQQPDVVVMDIEMPVKNGIEATKEIMQKSPRPILMFSSLTLEGAQSTLDALAAGAADFVTKQFDQIAERPEIVASLLQEKIKILAKDVPGTSDMLLENSTPEVAKTEKSRVKSKVNYNISDPPLRATGKSYKILLIGTSTGGPAALQEVLTQFPKDFPTPILLIQHMPAAFTPAFASRLDSLCEISVKEAADGDELKVGSAYLAPGGKQMTVSKVNSLTFKLNITDGDEQLIYHPSVDETFKSAANQIGGDILSVVLTGMGADGKEGAKILKEKGATIWAQDEASSVVYGMPQAVASEGLSSHSIALEKVASCILKEMIN